MVNPFEALELSVLIERLAEYTYKFTQLVVNSGFQPEVEKYKHLVEDLIAEIQRRKTRVA